MSDDTIPPEDTPPTFTVVDGDIPQDSAPKRQRRRASLPTSGKAKSTRAIPGYEPGVIAKGLTNFYGQVGMMVGMFDPTCGQTIVANAQPMAESLEKAAKQNPELRAWLMKLVSTSVLGEVIAAHTPVALAIFMHHTAFGRAKMEAATKLTDEQLARFAQQQQQFAQQQQQQNPPQS